MIFDGLEKTPIASASIRTPTGMRNERGEIITKDIRLDKDCKAIARDDFMAQTIFILILPDDGFVLFKQDAIMQQSNMAPLLPEFVQTAYDNAETKLMPKEEWLENLMRYTSAYRKAMEKAKAEAGGLITEL